MDGGEGGRREDGAESTRDRGIGEPEQDRARAKKQKSSIHILSYPPPGGRLRFPSLGVGFAYKEWGG